MATDIRLSTPTGTTNAAFVAWGSAVAAGLQAVGLVQSADTGQINWGTTSYVPPSTSTGTMAGYEIYRFSDALQATAPVFIKVEYWGAGGTSGTNQFFPLCVTVGTGTNGAGTLTGNVSQRWVGVSTYTGSNLGATNSYASGDGSRVVFAQNLGAGGVYGVNGVFSVERSRDASGNPTGQFVVFQACAYGWNNTGTAGYFSRVYAVIPPAGQPILVNESNYATNSAWQAAFPADLPSSVSTGSYAGTLNVFPHYPFGLAKYNPTTNLISYFNTDTAGLVQIPVTIYGQSHTYLPLGGNVNYTHCTRAQSGSGASLLMRLD